MADSIESTQTSIRRDSGISVGGIRVYNIAQEGQAVVDSICLLMIDSDIN